MVTMSGEMLLIIVLLIFAVWSIIIFTSEG